MPTPTKPVNVAAKSTSLAVGDYVVFRNLTSGGKTTVKCTSDGEAVGTITGGSEGDTISAEIQGRFAKGSTTTVSKGGVKLNLGTLTADDSPAIDL